MPKQPEKTATLSASKIVLRALAFMGVFLNRFLLLDLVDVILCR